MGTWGWGCCSVGMRAARGPREHGSENMAACIIAYFQTRGTTAEVSTESEVCERWHAVGVQHSVCARVCVCVCVWRYFSYSTIRTVVDTREIYLSRSIYFSVLVVHA